MQTAPIASLRLARAARRPRAGARTVVRAGSVVRRFTHPRAGEVGDVVVDHRTGHQILDRAALATVTSRLSPHVPEQAWASAPGRVFTVPLDLDPNIG